MTKQILLKTPRGNTAVIPVDHFVAKAKAAAAIQKPTLLLSSEGDDDDWHDDDDSSSIGNQYPTTEAQEDAAAIAAAVDTSQLFAENDCEDSEIRRSKEDLLLQLIGASKRRDVGRKRSLRSVYNLQVEEEEDNRMEIDERHGSYYSNSEEEQKVATRFDEIDINRDEDEERVFKSRKRSYSYSGIRNGTPTSNHQCQPHRRRRPDPAQSPHNDRAVPYEPISLSSSSPPLRVAFYHQGRKVSLDRIWDWITGSSSKTSTAIASNTDAAHSSNTPSTSTIPQFPLYLTLSTSIRLLGGIDRQNRVGSKFGGGGVSSSQNADRERKERLKQLALESIDLAKDPYLMRNHLGTYECKLCLTLHTNEANYLAHTQGKKHQAGLAKRAHMEKLRREKEEQLADRGALKRPPSHQLPQTCIKVPKIGRPAYQVFKSKDPQTNQRCLSFELTYKDISEDIQPRHRFMSAFEQRVETFKDKRYQYVLFAAEPYETIAFKIPNEPLDRDPGRLITHWEKDDKKFTLTLYFADQQEEESKDETIEEAAMDTTEGSTTPTPFAAALTGA